MIGILIVLVAISIRISSEHFTQEPAASCELANKCNHTWQPICGQQQHELTKRIFLDECDMHEYNCDNKISYIKVTLTTCAYKCTRNELNTPKYKPSSSITTDTTDTETTTTLTTVQSSTTNTETTTTHTTTQSSTTEIETTAIDSAENSSENNSISEDPTTTTTTSTQPVSTTTTTSTTTTPITTNEPTIIETTTEVTSNDIETDEETTTEHQTSEYTKKSTTGILRNCTDMDKDCFVPSTWETTHATETRDFYQIIRDRFGDKVKFLRHTTHFARRYK